MSPKRLILVSTNRLHAIPRIIASVSILVLAPTPSAGAVHTVCASGCDFTLIAAAIGAAASGDEILIDVQWPQVHTEASIVADKNLTIRGLGREATVLQAAPTIGEATDRILAVRQGASVFLEDLTLRHGNTPGDGGAVIAIGAPGFTTDLTVKRVLVQGNRADGFGGGLHGDLDSTVRIFDSVIEANGAGTGGGLCSRGSDLLIRESLVRGNGAQHGGGICLTNGDLVVVNTTITENVASIEGGGLYMPSGIPTIHHATIVGNASPMIGGISFLSAAVSNSVIANNPGGDCDGPIGGAGPRNWDSDGSCGISVVGTGDPKLEPLRDNGGPTWTLAPQEDSPLVDAGLQSNCFASDQRSLARALGGDCDIGAYERYELETCQSPNVAIPDNDLAGFSQTVILDTADSSIARVIDVNASLWVTHEWVGDLTVDLSHDGLTVAMIDRPGVPVTMFGCGSDNILASLDSSAVAPVEDECDGGAFAIGGRFRPNSSLNGFNGRAGNGEWTFAIADHEQDFDGTLLGWCVHVELFDALPDQVLFADGFESGDLSAWTASIP